MAVHDKTPPEGFRPMETDSITGKTVGWEPAPQSAFWKYLSEAIERYDGWTHGTYELIGPKINGNPEQSETHQLVRHGQHYLGPSIRTYDSIREYLISVVPDIEGFVYHHPDGRMAKIKKRDFAPLNGGSTPETIKPTATSDQQPRDFAELEGDGV
jgi:hypothetical protein